MVFLYIFDLAKGKPATTIRAIDSRGDRDGIRRDRGRRRAFGPGGGRRAGRPRRPHPGAGTPHGRCAVPRGHHPAARAGAAGCAGHRGPLHSEDARDLALAATPRAHLGRFPPDPLGAPGKPLRLHTGPAAEHDGRLVVAVGRGVWRALPPGSERGKFCADTRNGRGAHGRLRRPQCQSVGAVFDRRRRCAQHSAQAGGHPL